LIKGRFVLSKALLTHAINIIQQNADTVRYFQPTHEHVINSDASIVLLKKIRRNLRSHREQPGEAPNQQLKTANESTNSTHNNDYTAVLENGIRIFCDKLGSSYNDSLVKELAAHLNSAIKARQNCA
jgi:hypothetical protein